MNRYNVAAPGPAVACIMRLLVRELKVADHKGLQLHLADVVGAVSCQ
jgi:hypothetical protein